MIYGPRVDFQSAWHPLLAMLEAIVPGAEVYGWTGRWLRPKPGTPFPPTVAYGQVRIALHSAWRVEEELRGAGIADVSATPHGVEGVRLDLTRSQLLDYGWQVVFEAVQRGELSPDALIKGAPHQFRVAAKAATRPWYLQRWAAGCLTGDTVVVANRAGRGFHVSLREFVEKFNGKLSRCNTAPGGWTKWDPAIPTQVQVVVDGYRRLGVVARAWESGVKPVYRVTCESGRQIRASAEHPFLTPKGWRRCADLQPGGHVLVVPTGGRAPWDRDDKHPEVKQRYKQIHLVNHPFSTAYWAPSPRYRAGGKHVWRVPLHRVVMEAALNGMHVTAFVAAVRAGAKEDLPNHYIFLDPAVYAVHHRDRNTSNNAPENLEVATHHEHWKDHGEEHTWRNCTPATRADVVTSVELVGEEMTYDIMMREEPHNFVANGFVVHNSGKTLGACMAFLSRPGGVLIIVPAKARKEWKRSKHSTIGKFTELDPFCLLPMSERRAKDEELPAYLERCRQQGLRPVVVVGMEALSTYTAELAQFSFAALHVDELHELGSSAIFKMQANQDGSSRPVNATTATGEVPRAVAAYALTRRSSVILRGAATATPLDDGATKRMWGPLGLLSPGGFGRLGAFTGRYSNAQRIDGYWNTDGASCVPELRQRCSFIFDDVPRHESHRGMQQRIEVTYLSSPGTGKPGKDWTVQNRPDAFTAELKAAERAARQTGGHVARMQVRECRLAEAASRKRVAIRTRHAEFHADGQKTVVLMTRREMVEQWAAEWREAFGDIPNWAIHGDTPQDERDAALDTFREVEGAAWIIGTGYAIGTGVNGMQFANLLTIAQLPEKPGPLIQWVGRGDRIDGVGTLIWIPVAEGTQDDYEIARLIRKFGPIERLLDAPELTTLSDLLEGDGEELEDSIIAKLLK